MKRKLFPTHSTYQSYARRFPSQYLQGFPANSADPVSRTLTGTNVLRHDNIDFWQGKSPATLSRLSKSVPTQGYQFCSGCEQSYPDHTARKLLLGLARQTFRPDYAREEPERRPVRTPVSVLVMLLVGLRRSGSSGSQQNTFSNLGGLDLLHPKVVDLAPPYSQRHAHALWYISTLNYNSWSVPGELCSGRLTPTSRSCLTAGNKLKPNELTL